MQKLNIKNSGTSYLKHIVKANEIWRTVEFESWLLEKTWGNPNIKFLNLWNKITRDIFAGCKQWN